MAAVPTNENSEALTDAPELCRCERLAAPLTPGADEMKSLQAFVGGFDALMRLDDEPIPNEGFDWSSVERRDVVFVAQVLELVDGCCDQLLDDEFRTIARRILARVAARDPRTLRRSGNADRFAAGLVWLAARGSGRFARGARPKRSQLWRWFGVTDCSERGRRLRAAANLFPAIDLLDFVYSGELALGDAELLHSEYRRHLIIQRDLRLAHAATHAPRSPVVSRNGARLVVEVEPIAVLGAAKSLPIEGERLGVCIMLGADLDEAKCYELSIPDARKLLSCVQAALDDPPPDRS